MPGIKVTARTPSGDIPVVYPAVAEWILAVQQRCAGRGALGHRIGIVKEHSALGEPVDIGCFHFFAAVAAQPFGTEVVDHDEKDVRAFF